MTTPQFRSTSEQLLKDHLENRDDVDWYYKNGDTGQQYLSIIYGNNLNKNTFYSKEDISAEEWKRIEEVF